MKSKTERNKKAQINRIRFVKQKGDCRDRTKHTRKIRKKGQKMRGFYKQIN